MSNIYYGAQPPFKKTAIKLLTKLLRIAFPSLAMKISRKVLLKPYRRENTWPENICKTKIKTRHGDAQVYQYGTGQSIWLVHGWSGAGFQFWPLMQKLAEKGFSTITFDLPAHGYSEGTLSSLPRMIQAFDDISNTLEKPGLVITHSMGASVIANSQWINQYQNDLLLIAPLLETFDLLQTTVNNTGFDQVLFDRIIAEVLATDHMHIPQLDAYEHFINFTGSLKIIHDITDKFAPIEQSKYLAKKSGAELYVTDNLGHSRILRSSKLLKII